MSIHRRVLALLAPGLLGLLGLPLLASCHPGVHGGTPMVADDAYPRCLAFDQNGNTATCRAPGRVYDGDSCVCGDGHGRTYYGRVQEYPR